MNEIARQAPKHLTTAPTVINELAGIGRLFSHH